jgi:hypothetical protein
MDQVIATADPEHVEAAERVNRRHPVASRRCLILFRANC